MCKDLPSAFTQYNEDILLYKGVMKSVLSDLSLFLKKGLNQRLETNEISKLINRLEEAERNIQDNDFDLFSEFDTINSSLEECLNLN